MRTVTLWETTEPKPLLPPVSFIGNGSRGRSVFRRTSSHCTRPGLLGSRLVQIRLCEVKILSQPIHSGRLAVGYPIDFSLSTSITGEMHPLPASPILKFKNGGGAQTPPPFSGFKMGEAG